MVHVTRCIHVTLHVALHLLNCLLKKRFATLNSKTFGPPIQEADWLSLMEEIVETLTAMELRGMGLVVKEANKMLT